MSDAQLVEARRADRRRRAGGRPPHLQPPLGRPGDVREARRRSRRTRSRELTGGRLNETCRSRSTGCSSSTTTSSSAGRCSRTRSSGFSGGTKYLFPGIAAPEIIHFTHWLGALITSYEVIGTMDTPVRAVIDRAASLLDTPLSLLALVVTHDGVAGMYCGDRRTRRGAQAAALSARRHIVWVDKPYERVLAVMPPMYDDLWTAAKGMYKIEPAVADGGEVVIYAPHVTEVSYVHGKLIDEIGYHCRDYFLAQWERFKHYPGGILAHSTHVKGWARTTPRAASRRRASASRSRPASRASAASGSTSATWIRRPSIPRTGRGIAAWLVVPRAGEMLYRVGQPPTWGE